VSEIIWSVAVIELCVEEKNMGILITGFYMMSKHCHFDV